MLTTVYLLIQQASNTPGATPDDTAIKAVLIVGGGLFMQSFYKDAAAMIHSLADDLPKRLEIRRQEKVAQTTALQVQTDQTKKLFEVIDEQNVKLAEFSEALLKSNRLMYLQRKAFNKTQAQFREEMASMVQQMKAKDDALQALTMENLQLKRDNEKLRQQIEQLQEELNKRTATASADSHPPPGE